MAGGGERPDFAASAEAIDTATDDMATAAAAREAAAVSTAVDNIRSAAAEAIAQRREVISTAADRILDTSVRLYETRERLLSSLSSIFNGVIDLEPWRHLGSHSHLIARFRDLENMYNNQYGGPGFDRNSSPGRYQGTNIDAGKLPREVLASDLVQSIWFFSNDFKQEGVTASDGSDFSILHPKEKFSWVSDLEDTFKDGFPCPDFHWTVESPPGEEPIFRVNEYWPQGWLTNLEIAMSMIGYYCQVGSDLENHTHEANLSRPALPSMRYTLFDSESIRNFRSGDVMKGMKTILHSNHSYEDSWHIRGQPADGPLPGSGESGFQDPKTVISRIFSTAGNTCGLLDDAGLQYNANFTSRQAGPAPMVADLRPFTLLSTGGPLAQVCLNSINSCEASHQSNGRAFLVARAYAQQYTGYKKVSGRLKAHATYFDNLQDIAAGYVTAERIEKFKYLAAFLRRVASVLDSDIDAQFSDHNRIIQAHREIIRDTCRAYADNIDFDSDDDIDWPFTPDDDWDDHLGPLVAAAIAGDAIGDLNETFVGTGQTSVLFKEQCFLLSFVSDFATFKKQALDASNEVVRGPGIEISKSKKTLPYYETDKTVLSGDTNSTILMDGGSYGFLNLLTQNPKLSRFYNINNHELSNLQPKIRLWKVIFDQQGNEKEIPISFESHFSATELNMFKNSAARGAGVGLKSFNFTYDGSNPFSVKKSIKANLKIFSNTMSEILRDRPGSYRDGNGELQSVTYKYSDLAMKTWSDPDAVVFTEASADGSSEGIDPILESLNFDMLTENANKAELNFRLKAQIGFSAGLNEMSTLPYDLREALQESHVTVNLTPTVHNFEIDEFGRVVFNINYLAYVEQFFDQTMFNVFTSKDITLSRIVRDLAMKYYTGPAGCSADQINSKKEEFADIVKTEQEQAISSLVAEMMTNQMIYYVNMPYEKIRDFLSSGPHGSYNSIMDGDDMQVRNDASHDQHMRERVASALSEAFAGAEGIDEENEGALEAALIGNDPRETDLSFFFMSDLIDMVLRKIEKGLTEIIPEMDTIRSFNRHARVIEVEDAASRKKDLLNAQTNLKKLRIMLGPMELTHPKAKDGYASNFVNLGDVPVSLKYFVEWLTNKMLQKDEVIYPLTRFVNDLINSLLNTFLNADNCFGYSIRQKTRLNQATITAWGENDTKDPITQQIAAEHALMDLGAEWTPTADLGMITPDLNPPTKFRGHVKDFAMPVLNPSGPSGARTAIPFANEYNFMVFFAGRTMPEELMNGIKSEDEARGIFHYMIGRDKGLIKNIKLTKTQTKGLAEVRFEQEGYEGLEQLRVVYDAKVDMYASVNTFPGTYIYIDPKGFAPEGSGTDEYGLTDLGIGGYYMIIRSEHEFAEGKANTILHTKWVNQIDREEDDRQNGIRANTAGTGGRISRRCAIQIRPPTAAPDPDPPGFFDLFF